MTATPYLLQLPDPDTSPAPSDGIDTMVIVAESSADALAFAQNFGPRKVWANVTPATLAEASDMAGWNLRVAIFNPSDDSTYLDRTVTNASEVERVVLASGVLTSSENYAATDTVTIGGKTYTFVSPIGVTEGNVLLGVDEATSIANLAAAINHSAGAGTTYVAAAAHPSVTAVAAAHTLTVTAHADIVAATANAIASTVVMHAPGNGAWGGTTLAGGVDSENHVASLAELMIAALSPLHASFNNSTHTLTVASIADDIGDHILRVELTPPQRDPVSPTGVATKAGQSIPGMVSTIVDGGIAGAVLSVVLVADNYGIPKMVVQGRVLQ